jgi:hypothetical protein
MTRQLQPPVNDKTKINRRFFRKIAKNRRKKQVRKCTQCNNTSVFVLLPHIDFQFLNSDTLL